jgi:hypothetical protein
MQWARPRATRWGRPKLVCNVMEKMLKAIQNDGLGWKHTIVAKNCSHKYIFWNYATFNFHQAKEVFINYIQNKVVQQLNNAIVKKNYIFLFILNDLKNNLWELICCHNIIQSANILFKWFK